MTETDEYKPLESVLLKIDEAMDNDGGNETNLKNVLAAFGDRAFGPVLVLVGLFLMTPLGALPGVPIAFGVVVTAFSVQIIFGRKQPWLPKSLSRIKITKNKLEKTKKVVRPWLARIDGLLRPRLHWAAAAPFRYAAACICTVLAFSMVPLGAIPFGVALPGFIIGILGLGIMARDGLLMLIGLTLSIGVIGFTIHVIVKLL